MADNKHKYIWGWNHNNEIYISYNGNEYNDYCKYVDIDNFIFIIVLEKN